MTLGTVQKLKIMIHHVTDSNHIVALKKLFYVSARTWLGRKENKLDIHS